MTSEAKQDASEDPTQHTEWHTKPLRYMIRRRRRGAPLQVVGRKPPEKKQATTVERSGGGGRQLQRCCRCHTCSVSLSGRADRSLSSATYTSFPPGLLASLRTRRRRRRRRRPSRLRRLIAQEKIGRRHSRSLSSISLWRRRLCLAGTFVAGEEKR